MPEPPAGPLIRQPIDPPASYVGKLAATLNTFLERTGPNARGWFAERIYPREPEMGFLFHANPGPQGEEEIIAHVLANNVQEPPPWFDEIGTHHREDEVERRWNSMFVAMHHQEQIIQAAADLQHVAFPNYPSIKLSGPIPVPLHGWPAEANQASMTIGITLRAIFDRWGIGKGRLARGREALWGRSEEGTRFNPEDHRPGPRAGPGGPVVVRPDGTLCFPDGFKPRHIIRFFSLAQVECGSDPPAVVGVRFPLVVSNLEHATLTGAARVLAEAAADPPIAVDLAAGFIAIGERRERLSDAAAAYAAVRVNNPGGISYEKARLEYPDRPETVRWHLAMRAKPSRVFDELQNLVPKWFEGRKKGGPG